MSGQPERPETDTPEETAATGEQAGADESRAPDAAEELAELKARAEETWNKYLRAMAELENVRKRAARDVDNARRFALEQFARELLKVRDSLELGLAAADDSEAETLREGSEATLKLLASTMEQFGIAEVDPLGEPFDPQYHEAMTTQPSATSEPGSVLTVYQKGYTLNGRLLRPARVVVAAEPPPDDAGATAGDGSGDA